MGFSESVFGSCGEGYDLDVALIRKVVLGPIPRPHCPRTRLESLNPEETALLLIVNEQEMTHGPMAPVAKASHAKAIISSISSLAGTVSLNAGGDLRILCRIYEEEGDTVALLQIVGTHSQLYG